MELALLNIILFIYYGIGLILIGFQEENLIPFLYFIIFLIFFNIGFFSGYKLISPNKLSKPIIFCKRLHTFSILFWTFIAVSIYIYIFLYIYKGFPIFNPFLITISPGFWKDMADLIFLILIIDSYISNRKKIFYLITIIYILLNIISLKRYPIGELILILILLDYNFTRSLKNIFKYGLILTLFLFIIGGIRLLLFHTSLNIIGILYKTLYKRTIEIGAETLYFIFSSWENYYPYYYGLTVIKKITNILGLTNIPNIGYLLYKDVKGTTGGYDPISIIGDIYINFGYLGLIPGSFYLGFLWGIIISFFKRKITYRKVILNVRNLIIYSLLVLIFWRGFAYSLAGQIYEIILVFSTIFLIYFFDGLFSKRKE